LEKDDNLNQKEKAENKTDNLENPFKALFKGYVVKDPTKDSPIKNFLVKKEHSFMDRSARSIKSKGNA